MAAEVKPRPRTVLAPLVAGAVCTLGLRALLPARRGPPAGFVAGGGIRPPSLLAAGPRAAAVELGVAGAPRLTGAPSTAGWLPGLAAGLGLAAAAAGARASRVAAGAVKDWKIRWCGRVKPSGGGTGKHGVRPTDALGCAKIYDRWKRRWRVPELLYSESALYNKKRDSKKELQWRQFRASKRITRKVLTEGEKKIRVDFIKRQQAKDKKGLTMGLHFDLRHLATWVDVDMFRRTCMGQGQITRLEKQRDKLGFPCPPVRLTDHVFKVIDGQAQDDGGVLKSMTSKAPRPLGTINKERIARKAAKAARKMSRRKKGV